MRTIAGHLGHLFTRRTVSATAAMCVLAVTIAAVAARDGGSDGQQVSADSPERSTSSTDTTTTTTTTATAPPPPEINIVVEGDSLTANGGNGGSSNAAPQVDVEVQTVDVDEIVRAVVEALATTTTLGDDGGDDDPDPTTPTTPTTVDDDEPDPTLPDPTVTVTSPTVTATTTPPSDEPVNRCYRATVTAELALAMEVDFPLVDPEPVPGSPLPFAELTVQSEFCFTPDGRVLDPTPIGEPEWETIGPAGSADLSVGSSFSVQPEEGTNGRVARHTLRTTVGGSVKLGRFTVPLPSVELASVEIEYLAFTRDDGNGWYFVGGDRARADSIRYSTGPSGVHIPNSGLPYVFLTIRDTESTFVEIGGPPGTTTTSVNPPTSLSTSTAPDQ